MAVVAAGVAGLAAAFPDRITTMQDAGQLVGGVLWAGLAAALLLETRGAPGRMRHAGLWILIVGALALGYAYRGELGDVAMRVRSELTPGEAVASAPQEMVFSQVEGGHFVVRALVNGQPVEFLADTGASNIVLSPADARRLGAPVESLTYDRLAETANGVGRSARWRADSLAVGALRLDGVDMEVNQAPMSVSLLGMDFFRRLDSFRVEDGRLYLRWRD
jgi:aspartyl protease family protein